MSDEFELKAIRTKYRKIPLDYAEDIVKRIHKAYEGYKKGSSEETKKTTYYMEGEEFKYEGLSFHRFLEINVLGDRVYIQIQDDILKCMEFDFSREGMNITRDVKIIHERDGNLMLRIFYINAPIESCFLSPCTTCEAYLDCKRGGYKE